MIGRADLVLSGVQGPVTADQRRSLELLIGHAERLSAELEQMAQQFEDYVRRDEGAGRSGNP
jgi:hypothetical protein